MSQVALLQRKVSPSLSVSARFGRRCLFILLSYVDDVMYWVMLLRVKEGRVVLIDIMERYGVYVNNII